MDKQICRITHRMLKAACVFCLFVLFAAGHAYAVYLTRVGQQKPVAVLCPRASCPALPDNPFNPGKMIPVYETVGGFARVSKFTTREQVLKNYPALKASKLLEKVALWVNLEFLVGDADQPGQMDAKAKEGRAQSNAASNNADSRAASRVPSNKLSVRLPKKIPVPVKRPIKTVENAQPAVAILPAKDNARDGEKSSKPVEKAKKAASQQSSEKNSAVPIPKPEISATAAKPDQDEVKKPVVDEKAVSTNTQTPGGSKELEPVLDVSIASTGKNEPVRLPSSSERPKKLTRELLDKRLAMLPVKPGADYTLSQIIAVRHYALQLLLSGECTGIQEGGKTANQGYFFVVCEGEYSYRQFAE